jgi:hypothetical protein
MSNSKLKTYLRWRASRTSRHGYPPEPVSTSKSGPGRRWIVFWHGTDNLGASTVNALMALWDWLEARLAVTAAIRRRLLEVMMAEALSVGGRSRGGGGGAGWP